MNLCAPSQIDCKSEGPEEQNRLQNFFFLYQLAFKGVLVSILDTVSAVLITSQVYLRRLLNSHTDFSKDCTAFFFFMEYQYKDSKYVLLADNYQYKEFTTY